jgi:UDP-GlcNAc:undecaprenyl-phosphate GlcNAc-1-phosphate transferase
MIYLYAFIAAFLMALVLTPVIRAIALRAGIMDVPNHRSLHNVPVAKTGGIAIYFAFVFPVIWVLGRAQPHMFWMIAGATIMLMVGFLDDTRGMSSNEKLLGQVLAALILVGSGIKIGFFPDVISIPLTLFWLVGITNAVNLLDGMDGMAAGVSAIVALFFMVLALRNGEPQTALLAVVLAGACLGFLRFNFHKAAIFMGDTGSLFLGFVLGLLGVLNSAQSSNVLQLSAPVILLGLPILDTSLAVVRRVLRRRPLFEADCDHFYEWLWKNRILEYRSVVIMTYFVCLMLGLGAWLIGGM